MLAATISVCCKDFTAIAARWIIFSDKMNPTEKGQLIARALIARALIARALIARAAKARVRLRRARGFGGRGNKTGHVIGHVIDCKNM